MSNAKECYSFKVRLASILVVKSKVKHYEWNKTINEQSAKNKASHYVLFNIQWLLKVERNIGTFTPFPKNFSVLVWKIKSKFNYNRLQWWLKIIRISRNYEDYKRSTRSKREIWKRKENRERGKIKRKEKRQRRKIKIRIKANREGGILKIKANRERGKIKRKATREGETLIILSISVKFNPLITRIS